MTDLERAIRETLAIEERRKLLLDALLDAAERGDVAGVIRCGRELRGEDAEARHRTAPSQ